MLTDFQNYVADELSSQDATKSYLNILPNIIRKRNLAESYNKWRNNFLIKLLSALW